MLEITKSLLLILIISTGVAATGYTLLNTSFIGLFTLTTIIQLALGWFLRTYIESTERKTILDQQTSVLSQIEQEAAEAPCAYCGHINLIPILPNQDNDFECLECNEKNSVYVNITVAQKTVPIDAQPYEVTNFNENLQSAKDIVLSNEQT